MRRIQAKADFLGWINPGRACILQKNCPGLLQPHLHFSDCNLFGRVHAAFDRRRTRHLAAQILHREVVGRLGDAHVGRRQRGKHVRPAQRGLGVHTFWNQPFYLGYKHILEHQRARNRAAHAQRVPVTGDADAAQVFIDSQIQRVALRGAGFVQGTQNTVVVGRTGQRGENLFAVDDVATVHLSGQRAKRRLACGSRPALGKWLRIHFSVFDHTPVVHFSVGFMVGALLGCHVQVVGDKPGPHGRADMHVQGQGRGAAMAADLGGGHDIGGKVGAPTTMFFGYADSEQSGLAQVGVVLKWKHRVAVDLLGARCKLFTPQPRGNVQ